MNEPLPPAPGSEPPSARSQSVARTLLAIFIAAISVWILSDFLPPLIWAAIFAIATWPLYRRLVANLPNSDKPAGKHGKLLAPSIATFAVGLVFLLPLAFIAGELGREGMRLIRLAQSVEKAGLSVPDWVGHLPFAGPYVMQWLNDNMSDPRSMTLLIGRMDQSVVLNWTRTLGAQVLRRGTDLLFTLLTLFFLYRDGEGLIRSVDRAYDRIFGKVGERVGVSIVSAVRSTVNGLVLVGLGEGVVLGISYWVLGVPNAALLGALTAVVASIPFGAFIVFGSAALVLVSQQEPGHAIAMMAIGLVVLVIADQFVRPVLISGQARLPFVWVLFGIIGGLETVGLLGLFIGPAVMAALIVLWRDLTGEKPGPVTAGLPPPGTESPA